MPTPFPTIHQVTLDELIAEGHHDPSFSDRITQLNTPAMKVEAAIRIVHENADCDWKQAALNEVYRLCQTKKEFTTDDLWDVLDRLPVATRERRAMGAIMQEAGGRGWCRSTGKYEKSRRPDCHRRPVAIWESLHLSITPK